MNGTLMIARVRRLLKDVTDDTHKGEFWPPQQVVSALNASQAIFLNLCIKHNYTHYLHGLVKNTGNTASGALPADYLHVISGMVGANANSQRMARVYIGGEGEYYRCTKHDAVIINDVNVYYINNGTQGRGMITYYKWPSEIYQSSGASDYNNKDFEDFVYTDIIAIHASVLLGMKETQTQRDFKLEKRFLQGLSIQPNIWVTYPKNRDINWLMELKLRALNEAKQRAAAGNVS